MASVGNGELIKGQSLTLGSAEKKIFRYKLKFKSIKLSYLSLTKLYIYMIWIWMQKILCMPKSKYYLCLYDVNMNTKDNMYAKVKILKSIKHSYLPLAKLYVCMMWIWIQKIICMPKCVQTPK